MYIYIYVYIHIYIKYNKYMSYIITYITFLHCFLFLHFCTHLRSLVKDCNLTKIRIYFLDQKRQLEKAANRRED